MEDIKSISQVIEKEMGQFSDQLRELLDSPIPLMNDISTHILASGGKHIRPILTLLTAKTFGEINTRALNAALMIEILHTATLIHDDVVDDSDERRGKPSINALWGSKLAVLAGDFLLAQSLNLPVRHNDLELLRDCTDVVKELIEGEILQTQSSQNLDNTETLYFEIIRKKTALLLGICAKSGARATGASQEQILRMQDFGILMGLMFQMQDDLFDYLPEAETGKPTGNDLKEKKITLPLLHTLSVCSPDERSGLLYDLKHQTPELLENARVLVEMYQGVAYAIKRMETLCSQARAILSEMPENPAKNALYDLAGYIIARNK